MMILRDLFALRSHRSDACGLRPALRRARIDPRLRPQFGWGVPEMSRLVMALVLAHVSALTLSIPGLQPAGAATLDRIREAGAIKLGYRTDARPYSFRNESGQPAGYIVELCREVANAVAKSLGGVRVDFVVVPAADRFQAVHDRRIDILCDPSSVTLERRALVDFSLPTFLDGASVLARSSRPVQRFEDLAGRRVGVLANTTSEHTLRQSLSDLGIKAEIVTAADHNAGIELLTSDRIDAYFADRAIVSAMLYEGRLSGFQLSRQYFSYETYALALPRDDSAFRLLVDRTLARLYRSGRIGRIMAKTLGREPQDEMLRAMLLINALPER
jgi:ABC-type amino acid transport substrate-binding protein